MPCALFQSRYRAASHFRIDVYGGEKRPQELVSISLSSGFSFQVHRVRHRQFINDGCFNLVIERLLISGGPGLLANRVVRLLFQSRYRAASHFRGERLSNCSILVTFQSRYRAASHFRSNHFCKRNTSFWFQSRYRAASHFRAFDFGFCTRTRFCGFNLVIERLLISGSADAGRTTDVIWFQSRYRAASHFRSPIRV